MVSCRKPYMPKSTEKYDITLTTAQEG